MVSRASHSLLWRWWVSRRFVALSGEAVGQIGLETSRKMASGGFDGPAGPGSDGRLLNPKGVPLASTLHKGKRISAVLRASGATTFTSYTPNVIGRTSKSGKVHPNRATGPQHSAEADACVCAAAVGAAREDSKPCI